MGELQNVLVALLIFSAIITGFSLYVADLSHATGSAGTLNNLTQLSAVTQIQNATQDLESGLRNSQLTNTPLDVPLIIVSGAYNLLKLVLTSFMVIWESFVVTLATYLFLPTWATGILMGLMAIIVIFSILSALMRYPL